MQKIDFYKDEIFTKGIFFFLKARLNKIRDLLVFLLRKVLNKSFIFNGRKYHYLIKGYNYAWKNERTVEIPVVWKYVKQFHPENILEVGNVLSHYFPTNHEVLDKYEISSGVINQDVTTFAPKKKYDLIVSISTLEHVGWEEKPKEPLKILKSINNLKKLLSNSGQLIISLPIGYTNPHLNKLISSENLGLSSYKYLKRISANNEWKEVKLNDVKNLAYNYPFPNSNAVLIGFFKNFKDKIEN